LSYPIYTHHLIHERRIEAKITLEKIALNLEQYFLIHNTYEDATLETLGFPGTIANNNYRLNILSADNSDFLIEAKPQGQQQSDTTCDSLLLNSVGEKTITGTGTPSECWG
jgi:Tfp pilus assembly protein PilE